MDPPPLMTMSSAMRATDQRSEGMPGIATRFVDMHARRLHLRGELLQCVNVHAPRIPAPYAASVCGWQHRPSVGESTRDPVESQELLPQHEVHPAAAYRADVHVRPFFCPNAPVPS